MIIVTGGAGFIGSNIVAALNRRGERDILVVDHLKVGRKMHNLADLDIADYVDGDDFVERLAAGAKFGNSSGVRAIIHQGACSATTEWDGRYMMRNNFETSKTLLQWCSDNGAQFIYASSASVYGSGDRGFVEDRSAERPINVYAYSKFLFDQYVRQHRSRIACQVVGLRYFNVYGPRESHKGSMASTVMHFHNQLQATGVARLFAGTDGIADGQQRRDFVFVDDCVDVNLWFLDRPSVSGTFNVGTGHARSFADLAAAVLRWHGSGEIQYIPFPEHLKGAYQNYTQADIGALRTAGYDAPFTDIEDGVTRYLDRLTAGRRPQSQPQPQPQPQQQR